MSDPETPICEYCGQPMIFITDPIGEAFWFCGCRDNLETEAEDTFWSTLIAPLDFDPDEDEGLSN